MNKSFLPLLLFLGVATTGPAQNSAPSELDKKPAGTLAITGKGGKPERKPPGENADGLVLAPGELSVMVNQVEIAVPQLVGAAGEEGSMPNVIFGPGTEKLVVPAPLRLRQVTPVQALALIAAASGCTLEAIHAPDESGEGNACGGGQKIIGYKFVLDDVRSPTLRSVLKRPGQNVATYEQPIFTNSTIYPAPQLNPNTPANLDPKPTQGGAGGGTAGMLNIYSDSRMAGLIDREAPTAAFVLGRVPADAAPNTPSVRVYALGPIMGDLSEEDAAKKQVELQELVFIAMEHTNATSEHPKLSFHRGTMTLVVKGTSADHDLVDQIIRAMKENAESAAKGGFGGN